MFCWFYHVKLLNIHIVDCSCALSIWLINSSIDLVAYTVCLCFVQSWESNCLLICNCCIDCTRVCKWPFRSFEYIYGYLGWLWNTLERAVECFYVSWLHMMLYRCTICEITAIIGRGAGDINDIWTYPIAQNDHLGLLNIYMGILDGYEIRSSELSECCYVSWLHMMLYICTML